MSDRVTRSPIELSWTAKKNLHDKVVRTNILKISAEEKSRRGFVEPSFSYCTSQSAIIDLEIEKSWSQHPEHHQGSQQESKWGDK